MIPEADSKTVFEDIKRGAPPPRARDRGLTVRHLEQFFNPSIFQGFDDGPDSFYTIYRNLFTRLAYDESQFDAALPPLPSFGNSTWPWTDASNSDAQARTFYTYWLHFATAKDFTWMEQYDLNDAPDRRVRRYVLIAYTYLVRDHIA